MTDPRPLAIARHRYPAWDELPQRLQVSALAQIAGEVAAGDAVDVLRRAGVTFTAEGEGDGFVGVFWEIEPDLGFKIHFVSHYPDDAQCGVASHHPQKRPGEGAGDDHGDSPQ